MIRIRWGLLAAILCGAAPSLATPPSVEAIGLGTQLRCVMRDETHIAIVNSTSRTIPAGRQIAYDTVRIPDGVHVRGGYAGSALSPGSLVQLEVGASSSCRAWLPSSREP
jgi:hypothetical protein